MKIYMSPQNLNILINLNQFDLNNFLNKNEF